MDKQFEDVINYLKNNNIYLGQMTTPDIIDTQDGTKLCEFDWAALIRRPDSRDVFEVHGAIYKKWKECHVDLGWPISNEISYGNGGDRCSEFEKGKIVWYSERDQVEVILNPELQCKEQNESLQTVDFPVGCLDDEEEDDSSYQIIPQHIEKDVDQVIQHIKNKLSHKKEDAELLVHKVSEFLSKKFFVVMLGAIKAGKSTLVNSLVGREISPMGAGFETTLRSSIIIAADKNHPEGLYVYSFTQDQKNKLKEKIEGLERKKGNVDGDAIKDNVKKEWWQSRMAEYFAYLGEINPEFEKKYQCHKHAFNKDVIVEILTKEKVPLKYGYNDEESLPLLISIDTSKFKEQKVNLLNCQCAIIDTPGLDGAKANNQTDSLLKAANQYADYFLFIQSSMSALTGGCKKYLEENSQIPTVAVYNKMSSSYWYDEKSREDFENSKATVAYENLRNCTPYKFGIGDTVVVNAGAAWEAISRKNTDKIEKNKIRNLSQKYLGEEGLNKLLNESRLPEYIQELTKKIKETRIKIKVKNAKSKVIQEIKVLDKKYDDELSEEIKDKKNEIASLEEENKDIRAVKSKFDNDWLAEKSEHERVCYALSWNIKAKVKACIKKSMDNNGVKVPTDAGSTPDAIKLVEEALEEIKKHFYYSLNNDLSIQNDKFNRNSEVFKDSYNQQIFNENLDNVKKYIDNIASLQDKMINDLTFTEIERILNQKLTMPNNNTIVNNCLKPWALRWGNVIDKDRIRDFFGDIGNRWQSSVDSLDETLRTKISDIICVWGREAVDDKLDRKISENENKIVSFEKEIEGIESELSNLKSILVEIKGKVEQIKVN